MKAGYRFGYARRASESFHPELWDGLVGVWAPSVGPTGYSLRDISGTNHGVIKNTNLDSAWKVRQGDYALALDGTNDFVEVARNAKIESPSSQITMSAWFNLSAAPTFETVICKPFTAQPWSPPYITWLVRINNSTTIQTDVGNGSSYSAFSTTVPTIALNSWHHIGLTYKNGIVTAYYDGEAKGTKSNISGNLSYANYPLYFGRDNGAPTYFQGLLDDIRIYDRALPPSEMRTLGSRRGVGLEKKPERIFWTAPATPGTRIGDFTINSLMLADVNGSAIGTYSIDSFCSEVYAGSSLGSRTINELIEVEVVGETGLLTLESEIVTLDGETLILRDQG